MNLLKRTWLIVVILLAVSITARAISPTNLKCEYHINPLGIDIVKPLLSWISASTERGWKQTAYQILVASSSSFLDKNQGDLWNSGKLDTDCSNQIVYEGKALSSRLNCYWKVKVWDNKGKESEWSAPAYWSMGLLHSEEWKAQWIGIEQPKDKMESIIYFTNKGVLLREPMLG